MPLGDGKCAPAMDEMVENRLKELFPFVECLTVMTRRPVSFFSEYSQVDFNSLV